MIDNVSRRGLRLRVCLLAALLAASAPAAAGSSPKVDESALRYYAAHNDTARLTAEIRRLEALYPGWVAPTDLGEEGGSDGRETRLWALYAAGDMPALRLAITELAAADPGFKPSADLMGKLEKREARDGLIAASEAGEPAKVLALAEGHADLVGCDDLDVSWRVAAARAATGETAAAVDLYRRLLGTCDEPAGRLATIEKAVVALGPAPARPLLALERRPGEFGRLRPAFARAAVVAELSDPTAPAPEAEDLAALQAVAKVGPGPDDAALLGWWARGRHDGAAALSYFQTAATLAGPSLDAKIAEGLALSLADLGRTADAARVAHDNRDRSEALARLYFGLGAAAFAGDPRPEVGAAALADYAGTVERLASADGAAVLGWYFLDRKDAAEAGAWFARGLGWQPSEELAKGAVYAALAGRDGKAAKTLVQHWQGAFPALAGLDLGKPAAAKPQGKDPILLAFEAGDFAACVDRASARGRLKPDLSLIKGWCLMRLERPAEAARAFDEALAGPARVREDAAYGKSLAALASGDARGAVAAALDGVSKPDRRAEIGAAALAAEAQQRFASRDWTGALLALDRRASLAPETQDLALLRGWCLWHLGARSDARTLFVRLDGLLSTPATRRALATARSG